MKLKLDNRTKSQANRIHTLSFQNSEFSAICNPSIVRHKGGIIGLTRGETKLRPGGGIGHGQVVADDLLFFVLNQNYQTTSWFRLSPLGYPDEIRVFDLRLFIWRDQVWCSHPLKSKSKRIDGDIHSLSSINPDNRQISFVGTFQLSDFEFQTSEKNWGFFVSGEELFCIYSIFPKLIVLKADPDAPTNLTVWCEWNTTDLLRFVDPRSFVSLSSPPVEYAENRLMLTFHQHQNYRDYRHYGLTLDARTFKPLEITPKPVFSLLGRPDPKPGITMIMNCLQDRTGYAFSFGLADRWPCVLQISRDLDSSWVSLTDHQADGKRETELNWQAYYAYRNKQPVVCESICAKLEESAASKLLASTLLGLLSMTRDDPLTASNHFSTCINLAPQNWFFRFALAQSLIDYDRISHSIKHLQTAMELDNTQADVYKLLGDAQYAMRNFKLASATYYTRFCIRPADMWNLLKAANANSQLSLLNEAIKCIELALKTRPNSTLLKEEHKQLVLRNRRVADALATFNEPYAEQL